MSLEYQEEIGLLIDLAESLPNGPAKIAALEQAVRLADSHQDEDAGYQTRMALLMAGTFGGRHDLSLVCFSWCLAQFDKEPERYNELELLWRYKWVVTQATAFPHISRSQIIHLLEDMKRRYEAAGFSSHAVWQVEREIMMDFRDLEAAWDSQRKIERAAKDMLSNCPACDLDGHGHLLLLRAQLDEALAVLEPILEGKSQCAEVPHVTYPKLLIPLLKAGRVQEAAEFYRKAYPMVRDNPEFVEQWATALLFLILTDNLSTGLKLLQKHLGDAMTAMPDDQMKFHHAAGLLFTRLAKTGRDSVKLRLPDSFPPANAEGAYRCSELAEWFNAEAAALARQFDARNGNDAYTREVQAAEELFQYAAPVKLTRSRNKTENGEE